jgi:hypothetical protein
MVGDFIALYFLLKRLIATELEIPRTNQNYSDKNLTIFYKKIRKPLNTNVILRFGFINNNFIYLL